MIKVTDEQILRAIWHFTLNHLPQKVTMHYIGGGLGLCSSNSFNMEYAVHICTIQRNCFLAPLLGSSQSMARIKKLVADGHLKSDRRCSGGSFYFWFPEAISRPAFERCLQLMRDAGMSEECALVANYEAIKSETSKKLAEEFGDIDLIQEQLQ